MKAKGLEFGQCGSGAPSILISFYPVRRFAGIWKDGATTQTFCRIMPQKMQESSPVPVALRLDVESPRKI